MNTYALLKNHSVVNVIVADAEFVSELPDANDYVILSRGGIGWFYDAQANVFISPQPYPSWTLDDNYDWQPPTPQPSQPPKTVWNEQTQSWDIWQPSSS